MTNNNSEDESLNNSIINGSITDIRDVLNCQLFDPLVNYDNISEEQKIDIMSKDTRITLGKKHARFDVIISHLGGILKYIKSGSTGHTFKCELPNGKALAIKIVPYYNKGSLNSIYNINRPENAEIKMLKVLSQFVLKNETPHIILPILTFYTNIKYFVDPDSPIMEVVKKSDKFKSYSEFLKKYEHNMYYDTVSVLISEWANGGDLLDFLRNYYKKIKLTHWKVIFFQILATLAVIQSKYPSFRHNDFKANNVLLSIVDKKIVSFQYMVNQKKYIIPNIGCIVKIWDFDFACIPNIVDNMKVITEWTKKLNVTPKQHRYYDVHYFFNTLIKFGIGLMESKDVPDEVKEFINRVVPEKYRDVDVSKYVNMFVKKFSKKLQSVLKEYINEMIIYKYKTKKFIKLPDTDLAINHDEIFAFINKMIKIKYKNGINVAEKGRFLLEDEYLTPLQIIENDIFFKDFRIK